MTDIRHILTDESDDASSRPRYRTPDSHGSRGLPSPILASDERVDASRGGGFGFGARGSYAAADRPPPLALWAVPDDTPVPVPALMASRPWSLGPSQSSGTKRSGPSEPSTAQAPKRRREDESEPAMPPTPPMPPFLTHPPEICKHAPVSNIVGDKAKFTWGMKLITLTTASTLQIWTDQVEAIARESNCLDELTTRFTTFPPTGTVDAMVCKARFAACWSILRDTISGPVWAYMRVLGYRRIPVFKGPDGFQWQPTPYDCFYFAREASKRMDNPGSPGQSRQEILNMVEEAQMATSADYTSQRQFTKGKDWLMSILNKMIRDGDREVCEALYDLKPSWAPEWPSPSKHAPQPPGTPVTLPTHSPRPGSAPGWAPGPPLPRLGSLTPPGPAPLSLFSAQRTLHSPTFHHAGGSAMAPVPGPALPRPNSAPGSDHLPMPIPMPVHRRSISGTESSALPMPYTPIMGGSLPLLQPRPDSAGPRQESPTQLSPGLTPTLPPTPTFPGFHSTLEWSPSLTQEKMRNATWKELNVKVPTVRALALRDSSEEPPASTKRDKKGKASSSAPSRQPTASSKGQISPSSPQSSALRHILPTSTRSPKAAESESEGTGASPGTTKKPRKGYRFVHEIRKIKSEPEE